jgi:serine protease Do
LVVRDGEEQIFKAVLGGLDTDEMADSNSVTSSRLGLGFEVSGLSDSEKEELGTNSGVMVKNISDRNVQRAGLRNGDVILKISKTPINTMKQFNRVISKLQESEPIVLLVKQAGVNRFIVIERS